jgi:gibberellin 20-oxidase
MTLSDAANRILLNSGLLQSRTLEEFVLQDSDQPLPTQNLFSSSDALPTIDLYCAGAAEQLAAACRDWGFFQIQNHGIPLELLNRLRAHSHSFFELPLEQKERAAACSANNFYGYGIAKGRTYSPNAWMEAFHMEWTPASQVRRHMERIGIPQPQFEGFCEAVEQYASEAEKLAVQLMELVALGLGLDATTFSRHFAGASTSTVRMNYYPPCPQPSQTLGISPHSDFNIFTILLQDTIAGLQVLKDDDEWVTVKPNPNALVVNVGDTLHAWSNGRIKSVMHRALVNTTEPRLSVVYFFGPHPDTKIDPIPALVSSDCPLRYRSFVYKQFVEQILQNRGKKVFESPLNSLLL